MRLTSLFLLTAFLASGQPAFAQKANVTGATITWYGNLTATTKVVKDADNATGERYIGSGGVPPTTNSDQITLIPNTKFGFGFALFGTPKGATVELVEAVKYPSPGIPDISTGALKLSDQAPFTYTIGPGNNIFFVIGSNPSKWPTGVWTLQLLNGGTVLAEKSFTLSHP